ncbi:MAG: glutaredoxin 3 [Pseudomonadota bacterium]
MVTIYTAMLCPFCARAINLLKAKQARYEEIDVSFDPGLRAEMREKAGGRNSVPQIWIGERHVGGSDDLAALDRSGELDRLLSEA